MTRWFLNPVAIAEEAVFIACNSPTRVNAYFWTVSPNQSSWRKTEPTWGEHVTQLGFEPAPISLWACIEEIAPTSTVTSVFPTYLSLPVIGGSMYIYRNSHKPKKLLKIQTKFKDAVALWITRALLFISDYLSVTGLAVYRYISLSVVFKRLCVVITAVKLPSVVFWEERSPKKISNYASW